MSTPSFEKRIDGGGVCGYNIFNNNKSGKTFPDAPSVQKVNNEQQQFLQDNH